MEQILNQYMSHFFIFLGGVSTGIALIAVISMIEDKRKDKK